MGQIESQQHRLKNGKTVVIRTVRESDAESFLKLGKSIMSEKIYSMTMSEELTLTVEQEGAPTKLFIPVLSILHEPQFMYVYIITSPKTPTKHYIGKTQNPAQRLKSHNQGKCHTTKLHLPWKYQTLV
ncbi:MAG: GIY-YIG nuclease family protein [Bdellovibrionales bacterium]|nr:GIY-YIG nuclease family protein [Bdellovibrionales bacterium]